MSYEAPSADAISVEGEPYTAPDADNIVAEGGVLVAKLSTVASSQSEANLDVQNSKNASFSVSAGAIEALKTLNSENLGTKAASRSFAEGSVGVTAEIGSIIDSTSISSAIETAKASFAEIRASKSSVSEQTDVLATNIAPSNAFSGVKTTTKSQRGRGTAEASVSSRSTSITGGYLLRAIPADAASIGETTASESGSSLSAEAGLSPLRVILDEQTKALKTEVVGPTTEANSETALRSEVGQEIIDAVVSEELVSITRGRQSGAVPSRVSSSALSVWATPATNLVSPETRSVTEIDSEIEYPESRDGLAETKLTGTFGVAPESATVSFLLEEPLEAITNSPKSRSVPLSIRSTPSESLGTDNSDSALLLVSTDTIITALIERELQTIESVGFTDADSNTEARSAYSVPSVVDYNLETESGSDPLRSALVGVKADSNTEAPLQLPRSLFVEAASESATIAFLKLYGDPIVQPKRDIRPEYSLRRGRVKQKTAADDSVRYERTASTTYHSNSGEIEYGKSSSQE